MTVDLTHLVFSGFDYVWGRQRDRPDGLTREEYLWAAVGGAWTVDHRSGRWVPHPNEPAARPVPVPTIAWRMWHIADCLASYVSPHVGDWPLPVVEGEWYGEVGPALEAYDG